MRDPIERRGPRGPSRRSLFGGPPAPTAGTPAVPDTVPAETGPGADEACTLELSAAGELIDERGTIRLAERARPSITRTPAADELVVDTGWCWVARVRTAPPARVTLPGGTLVVPASARALAVVESDASTFVSVVAGAARLEHPSGDVTIPSGSIAHIPADGSVTLDAASPDEMAADAILTRNLRLDDALAVITRAASTPPAAG